MTIEAKREAIKKQLVERLVDVFIATRTPAPRGTPDWLSVRRSLECELFAKALPAIISNSAILALVEPQVSEDTVRVPSAAETTDLIERLELAAREEDAFAQEQDFWHADLLREAAKALTAAPASEPQALSEERAREVLALEWEADGRKDLANTIRKGRDTEWNKAAVAIRAMIRFAKEVRGE